MSRTAGHVCTPILSNLRARTRSTDGMRLLFTRGLGTGRGSPFPRSTTSIDGKDARTSSVASTSSLSSVPGMGLKDLSRKADHSLVPPSSRSGFNANGTYRLHRATTGLASRALSTVSSIRPSSSLRMTHAILRTNPTKPSQLGGITRFTSGDALLRVLGTRGFKTSSRRELAGASVAMGAMAILKVCPVGRYTSG